MMNEEDERDRQRRIREHAYWIWERERRLPPEKAWERGIEAYKKSQSDRIHEHARQFWYDIGCPSLSDEDSKKIWGEAERQVEEEDRLIRKRAHQIWIAEDRVYGRHDQDWAAAATDLRPFLEERRQVRALACRIWFERGRPEGCSEEIWLAAEQQVRAKAGGKP